MNRRLRLVGALVALLAFSAYFAEGVWAAACLPGMEDHASAHASAGMNHDSPDTSSGHDSPDAHQPHGASHASADAAAADAAAALETPAETPNAPDAPRCPLGMTGMGSTCVAASLPALVAAQVPALESSTVVLPAADALHDSLFTASHFRPPRA